MIIHKEKFTELPKFQNGQIYYKCEFVFDEDPDIDLSKMNVEFPKCLFINFDPKYKQRKPKSFYKALLERLEKEYD